MKPTTDLLPPITTPFVDGAVAPEKVRANVEALQRFDMTGLVVAGTTGEAPLLEEPERAELVEAVRNALPDDKLLMAGIGCESQLATIRLGRRLHAAGADVFLVLTPHFYRKLMTTEALIAFYQAVADKLPAPLYLYNNPRVTGIDLSLEVIETLSRHERIVGLKDSSGDFSFLLALLERLPTRFRLLVGSAPIVVPSLAVGAHGAILGIANVLPEPVARLRALLDAGRLAEAMSLQARLAAAARIILSEGGVPGVKAAMDLRGLYGGPPRPPLQPVSPRTVSDIDTLLDTLASEGVIPKKRIVS